MGRNERTQMPPGTSTKEKHTQLSAPRLTLIDRSSGPVTVRVVDLGEVATQLLEPTRQGRAHCGHASGGGMARVLKRAPPPRNPARCSHFGPCARSRNKRPALHSYLMG